MPLIEWSEALDLEYQPLDDDHMRLVGMVNELYDELLAGNSMTLIFARFERLAGHAAAHFRHEERLMEKNAYPRQLDHMELHHYLESQLQDFLEQFHVGESMFSLETVQFLKDWLLIHIKTADKNLGDYLNRRPGVGGW